MKFSAVEFMMRHPGPTPWHVAANVRASLSMSNTLDYQELSEAASPGFSEFDQPGSHPLIKCSHCPLTFPHGRELSEHCYTMHPSPNKLMPPPLVGHYVPSSWERVAPPSDFANTAGTTVDYTATNREGQITASTSVFGGGSRSAFTFLDFDTWFFSEQQPSNNSSTKGQISPQHYEKSVSTFNTEPPTAVQQGAKVSRRATKRDKWESIKEEVRQLYVLEGKTLEATMAEMQGKYSFKASLRKWKMQIKEWGFDKNLSKNDMAILVAKAEKRRRVEGKETKFYNGGQEIRSGRLAGFKKRKIAETIDAPSPSAATPMNITYDTPRYDIDMDDIQEEEGRPLSDHEPPASPETLMGHLSSVTTEPSIMRGQQEVHAQETGPTPVAVPVNTRDDTPNFDVEMYGFREEEDKNSSPKLIPPNGNVDPATDVETAAIECPLTTNDAWSLKEKFYLSRSIAANRKPGDRWMTLDCELALADLELCNEQTLETAAAYRAQYLVVFALDKYISCVTPLNFYGGAEHLDKPILAYFLHAPILDYANDAKVGIMRSSIHLIREYIKRRAHSKHGDFNHFKFATMFTKAAMLCRETFPLSTLMILDQIIVNIKLWKEGLTHAAHAYILLCCASICFGLPMEKKCEEDLLKSRKLVYEIEPGELQDVLLRLWDIVQQKLTSKARNV